MANQSLPFPSAPEFQPQPHPAALRPLFRLMFGLVSRPPPPQPPRPPSPAAEDISLFPSYPLPTHKNPAPSPSPSPPVHLKFTPYPLEQKTMDVEKDNSIQIITINAEYSKSNIAGAAAAAATKKPESHEDSSKSNTQVIKRWGRKLLRGDVKAGMKGSRK